MSAQIGLFGDLPATPLTRPARKSAPAAKQPQVAPVAALLPQRPEAWRAILAKRVCQDPPVLYVSALYTGATLETIGDSEAGYWTLTSRGKIFAGSPCGWFHRTIHLSIQDALDLHARWPLVPVKQSATHVVPIGRFAGSFRFAGQDETITERTGAIISAFRDEGSS